jgi:hypothetical protein
MRRLTGSAAALSILIASALSSGADDAWLPFMTLDADAQSNWQVANGGFGLPAGSAQAGKIDPGTPANDGVKERDPLQVFGQAGYYLYDIDAWQAAAAGPIIGPLRQRTYSLFGADSNSASLNRLTMGSELVRRDAGASRWRGSWSNPGWSF